MRSFWAIVGAGLLLAQHPAACAADLDEAVWKEQRLDFSYLGRTARYSCDGLRDKMRSLLLDMGARRDLKVSVSACNESPPLGKGYLGPQLHLVFSSPVLPQAGLQALHPGDLKAVSARYQPFTLTSNAFKNYGVGDCELVEEFARQILPKLSARDVKRDITCVPYQLSGSRFYVSGEILKAATTP
jgi:hypothetical protein